MDLRNYKKIVVLTGAGISAESGLSTFRDSDGLWEKHRVEDVATPEAFERDPRLVWRFYSARRANAFSAVPNAAHLALARFARSCHERGTEFFLVTQNVDFLHERAFRQLGMDASFDFFLAMHGTLAVSRCAGCNCPFWDAHTYFDSTGDAVLRPLDWPGAWTPPTSSALKALTTEEVRRDPSGLPLSPCCQDPLRPHIVWFGEVPIGLDLLDETLERCDLFATIGTSGNVYPAAGLLRIAKQQGATTLCLNKEPLPQQHWVDHFDEGPATDLVPRYFQ